jgi:CO/xanthine dehydrogenase Mo-binding subunit
LLDPKHYRLVGKPVPRVDIPGKVTGGEAYVQDLRLPDMVHGRVVWPPSYGAKLRNIGTEAAERLPGRPEDSARWQLSSGDCRARISGD